jgi:hypothetical protein
MNWIWTAFSAGLNENGFFKEVEWERHFRLSWMRTAFSYELNEDGFFKWVEWGRFFGWVDVRMMILEQSKRRRTLFRKRKFDILIRSI